jgi:hypothetical protein
VKLLLPVALAGLASCDVFTAHAVRPSNGIVVYPWSRTVELRAWTCLDSGPVYLVACAPRTRERESLLVLEASPSDVHGALLTAGFKDGSPGHWEEGSPRRFVPPTGDTVCVRVRYVSKSGELVDDPISAWIVGVHGEPFPQTSWVFSGSRETSDPAWMGGCAVYEADRTGAVIGLLTFGEEVVGFSRPACSDVESGTSPWLARPGTVPPVGTPVTLVLRHCPRYP